MMKRVLLMTNHFYPYVGGIEQVSRDIVNILQNDRIEIKVICFNETAQSESYVCRREETVHDIVDDVEIIRCGCIAKVASQSISPVYGRELKEVMNNYAPNIVIFNYPNPFAAHYLLKCKNRDFRLIIWWHLDITKQKILGKFFHEQNIKLLERADDVVATSLSSL